MKQIIFTIKDDMWNRLQKGQNVKALIFYVKERGEMFLIEERD